MLSRCRVIAIDCCHGCVLFMLLVMKCYTFRSSLRLDQELPRISAERRLHAQRASDIARSSFRLMCNMYSCRHLLVGWHLEGKQPPVSELITHGIDGNGEDRANGESQAHGLKLRTTQ